MAYTKDIFVLFLMILLFGGCFLANSPPLYEMHAKKYLKSHSGMTEQEIHDFLCNRDIGQERLLQLTESKSYQVRVIAATSKYLPAERLERMLDDKSWEVVRACSWNPNFTTRMFEKLVYHDNHKVRYYLANHDRLPTENLIVLSKDESHEVRGQVARNPRLPETEMRRLFLDESRWVKAGLAENPKVPVDILITLSKDNDGVVRKKVASNPNLPENNIRRLFSEKGSAGLRRSTRSGLVRNPNTPVDILIELSKDEIRYIRNSALQHPKMKQYRKMEQNK